MGEDDWFAKEMEKVQPLNKEKGRVQTSQQAIKKRKHQLFRNLEERETTSQHIQESDRLSVERADTWLLRADGVASKEIKNLARANISYELDLHGMTQDEAINQMQQLLTSALTQNIRQLCIVHGRGNHSTGKSILKELTYQWLEHGPFSAQVLVATPAVQSKGGACNVLLRKKRV